MLANDAESGHSNWVSHVRELQIRYKIQQTDNRSMIKTKVRKHFESKLLKCLKEHITSNKKLHLYASFKSTFKFETYLDLLPDFNIRSTLAKLRLSAHNLQIEAGRFHKNETRRDERFSLFCKTTNVFEIENEIHFLLTYPLFDIERKKAFEIIIFRQTKYFHMANKPGRHSNNKNIGKFMQNVI